MNKHEVAIKESFHLWLALKCDGCDVQSSPYDECNWSDEKNHEMDSIKMINEFIPWAISLGWEADNNESLYCPTCKTNKNT
jgi:hypothetical protein